MLETLLALSIVFGGWQWWGKERAHDDIEQLEQDIASYQASVETLREANESNASTITDLEDANDSCVSRYRTLLETVNDFRDARIIQDAEIDRLQDSLTGSDFAGCRVPDGISLEGLQAP